MKTTQKTKTTRMAKKGDQVMKIRGSNLYQSGKVLEVFQSRGVSCAVVAHRNILRHIEYFTCTLKQLEIL